MLAIVHSGTSKTVSEILRILFYTKMYGICQVNCEVNVINK